MQLTQTHITVRDDATQYCAVVPRERKRKIYTKDDRETDSVVELVETAQYTFVTCGEEYSRVRGASGAAGAAARAPRVTRTLAARPH